LEGRGRGPIEISQQLLGETDKNLSYNKGCPDRESSLAPPEFKYRASSLHELARWRGMLYGKINIYIKIM
jgi:hypothetical protein